jgi:hypothetical protein
MVQYRVYDRRTLGYADDGIVRDFSYDGDYLSDNASTVTLTEETYAKRGDILAVTEGKEKLFIGAITAVDNSKKQISFKNCKDLFNDTVLNVFKYTSTIGYKFDAVSALETLIKLAFIDTDDTEKRLPLRIEKSGAASGAVWTEDGDTLNLLDFIQFAFDSHNVYLDFDIDFPAAKIVCRIVKNTTSGVMIKDNIALSEPTFDKNELPTYNKAVVYDKDTGAIAGAFYLLADNTVTTNANDASRLLPVQTKYIEYDAERGATPLELAANELSGNIYQHCIQYKLSKAQRLVNPLSFNYGDGVKIIYRGREYDSIFTGLKYKKGDAFIACLFGKARIDFTDRLKQFLEKRYRKK